MEKSGDYIWKEKRDALGIRPHVYMFKNRVENMILKGPDTIAVLFCVRIIWWWQWGQRVL